MPWELDILTYYVAQPETQLFIYLSPPPETLLVFIRFDNGNKWVDFNLEMFSWSGRCN